MKRMIIALVAMFMMTFTTASAMSYEQAKTAALFLTDKMAYELNLTEDQYEAAYEVNLDYLMSVDTYDDLYGAYWRQRNMDLSYILPTGSIEHISMPPISTVRSTGMRATGTSASTPAIRAATISTSVALTSTYLTVEVIAGE